MPLETGKKPIMKAMIHPGNLFLKNASLLLLLFSCSIAQEKVLPFSVKIGCNIGNNFGTGTLGGAELEVEYARVGILVDYGKIWGIDQFQFGYGTRYYFSSKGSKLRPDLTLAYSPLWFQSYGYTGNGLSLIKTDLLKYGFSILVGFDHDFGKANGFAATYGIGIGFPEDFSENEKAEYFYRMNRRLENQNIKFPINIGIRYVF